MRFNSLLGVSLFFVTALPCCTSLASDWPMYRADAARSGYSPDRLPASLELRWVYRGSPPRPAWPSSARITYDFAHQPILVDGTVVFGSTTDDSVMALDVADGASDGSSSPAARSALPRPPGGIACSWPATTAICTPCRWPTAVCSGNIAAARTRGCAWETSG